MFIGVLSVLSIVNLVLMYLLANDRNLQYFLGVMNAIMLHKFIDHRAENALLTIMFLMLCVLEYGSLAVLAAEQASENANIVNAADAIW